MKTTASEMVRVADGRYEGTINGVAVRVIRTVTGYHPHHHTTGKTPEWKVYAGSRLVADGHRTMSGAIDSAAMVLA